MTIKNSAVDEFLGDLNETQDDPFESQVDETLFGAEPSEAPIEEPAGTEGEPAEVKLPFHKDPKVQKYVQKEIERALSELPKPDVTNAAPEVNTDVDDVLTRLIGNDTPEKLSMIKEFKSVLTNGTERAKKEALAELKREQQNEVQAERDAEDELEAGFESVEEHFGIEFNPNQKRGFATFISKVAPKDEYGEVTAYPDFIETYDTYQQLAKATQSPNRAKDLASRSMARSGESTVKPQERITWDTVDKIIGEN